MQETLIMYLHAHDHAQVSWAILSAEGTVRQSAYRDSLEGLATIAAEKNIIALIPAEDVVLTTVQMPKMSRAKLMQALPFALEEHIVTDIEHLHFAIADFIDGQLPVAMITHEKIQNWLQILKTAGLSPDKLFPAVFALPFQEKTFSVAITDIAMVRTDQFHGFACDHHNIDDLILLAYAEKKPTQINIDNYSAEKIAPTLPKMSAVLVEKIAPPEQFIIDLANHIAHAPTFNLLQGKYAVKKSRLVKRDKIEKMIAYLSGAFIAALFLYPTISYFILNTRVNELDSGIQKIYKEHFPTASSVVAPKLRMSEKLQKASADLSANRLLLLLGFIGKSLQTASNVKLTRLDYQNNQLTLTLTAATSADFSAFADALTRDGLIVKQQNATLSGERINATLSIN